VTELKGLATMTGIAEGFALELQMAQGQAFGTETSFVGKVLVTDMTNPGMIRQIKEASAVVCERGGRTCHAAIICREISKPCVVGVQGLLNTLATWTGPRPVKLKIDGQAGTVQFLDWQLVEE
jgi:phosphoenolpyruvate synthase/pyruvate phosphate dikinase